MPSICLQKNMFLKRMETAVGDCVVLRGSERDEKDAHGSGGDLV